MTTPPSDVGIVHEKGAARRRRVLGRLLQGQALLGVLLALVVVSLVLQPTTLNSTSLLSMLPFASILAISSIGQGLTIQQRGIDFSIGGTLSLSAVIMTRYPNGHDSELLPAIALALAVAVVIGLANGLAITKLRITPLIATLAVNAIVVGAVLSYSQSVGQSAPARLSNFAVDKTFSIPNTVLVTIAFVAVFAITLGRTVTGRRFSAVSTGPPAARVAGLHVDRYTVATYVVASLCYATAGILVAGYVQTPSTDVGTSYLLASITAVVIGGTPLGGGKGNVVGTALAALFLSQLYALIAALGAAASWQLLIQAGAIAIAAAASASAGLSHPIGLLSQVLRRSVRRPKPIGF